MNDGPESVKGREPRTDRASGAGRSIGTRVAKGLFWKILELSGAQGVQFVTALLLARLMTPEEYGTVGLIMIFIMIANVFVQSGLGTALIQKPDIRDEDYSSVFRLCLTIALPVYLLLCLGAPAVASYYERPVLSPLLRVMGLVLFPGAVIAVQTAYVSRAMDFRRLFISTMWAVVVSGVGAVTLAFRGFGVWAMVAQQLVYYAVLMAALFVMVPWRPGRQFSAARLRELFRFGWKMLVSGLIDTVWMNLYGLIIGKRYSAADLGGYSRAEQFPKLITQNLSSAIQSVLLPAYSEKQKEPDVLKNMLRESIRFSAFAVFPMMAGLIGCADPLIRVLLTDTWRFSVPYLRILCVCYAFWPVHVTNLQMITALGRSDLFLKLEIVKKCVGIAVLLFSIRYGIIVMLLFKAFDELLCTFINAYPVGRLIGCGIREQYRLMLPSFLPAAFMGALVYMMNGLPFTPGILLLIEIPAGVASYVLLSLVFNRETVREIRDLVRRRRAER